MKLRYLLVILGLLIFVGAFFLGAVGDQGSSTRVSLQGYQCATLALLSPWGRDGLSFLHDAPLTYISVLLSGWINPVFLISAFLLSIHRLPRVAAGLRIATLVMIPFCWVVFRAAHLVPREGHFVWVAGILLTLLSLRSSRTEART